MYEKYSKGMKMSRRVQNLSFCNPGKKKIALFEGFSKVLRLNCINSKKLGH